MTRYIFALTLFLWTVQYSFAQSSAQDSGAVTDCKAYNKVDELQKQHEQDSIQKAEWKGKYEDEKIAHETTKTGLANVVTNCKKELDKKNWWTHFKNGVLYVESAILIGAATYLYVGK